MSIFLQQGILLDAWQHKVKVNIGLTNLKVMDFSVKFVVVSFAGVSSISLGEMIADLSPLNDVWMLWTVALLKQSNRRACPVLDERCSPSLTFSLQHILF